MMPEESKKDQQNLELPSNKKIADLLSSGFVFVTAILGLNNSFLERFAPPVDESSYVVIIGVVLYLIFAALYYRTNYSKTFQNFCTIILLIGFIGLCFAGTTYFSEYNPRTLTSTDRSVKIVIGTVFNEGVQDRRKKNRQLTLEQLVEDDAAWNQPSKVWTDASLQESRKLLFNLYNAWIFTIELTILSACYVIVPRIIPAGPHQK